MLHNRRLKNNHLIFLLSYCYLYLILHKFCSVLTCDILGIGLLHVQYLFKAIICSSVRMKKSHTIPLRLTLISWQRLFPFRQTAYVNLFPKTSSNVGKLVNDVWYVNLKSRECTPVVLFKNTTILSKREQTQLNTNHLFSTAVS